MSFPYVFEELPGYQASYSFENGFRAVRKFRVSFSDHVGFMAAMIGAQFPEFDAVRCVSCDVEPQTDLIGGNVSDPAFDLAQYDDCFVVANYQSLQSPQQQQPPEQVSETNSDGTFFTYRQSMGSEFMMLPSRGLKWDDNDKPLPPDANAAVLIPKTEHHITWHKVVSPNWAVLSALRGRINELSVTIPVTGLSCDAETLLFEGCETSIDIPASGVGRWTVSVKLSEKKINSAGASAYGWNHAYRDNPAGWHKPKSNAGFMYKTGDFSSLFVQV